MSCFAGETSLDLNAMLRYACSGTRPHPRRASRLNTGLVSLRWPFIVRLMVILESEADADRATVWEKVEQFNPKPFSFCHVSDPATGLSFKCAQNLCFEVETRQPPQRLSMRNNIRTANKHKMTLVAITVPLSQRKNLLGCFRLTGLSSAATEKERQGFWSDSWNFFVSSSRQSAWTISLCG